MKIELHCENCGKKILAPRELAGKRGKCPACESSVYIPTPEDELEELPLAPEDANELQREAELLAERRKLDSQLAQDAQAENGGAPAGPSSAEPPGASNSSGTARSNPGGGVGGAGRTRTEQAVVNFLTAMRDSDLAAAEKALSTLKLQPRVAKETVDRLAADQIPPPEMSKVPPGVYQGFLKNLRSKL